MGQQWEIRLSWSYIIVPTDEIMQNLRHPLPISLNKRLNALYGFLFFD